jgi:hypothetical protein
MGNSLARVQQPPWLELALTLGAGEYISCESISCILHSVVCVGGLLYLGMHSTYTHGVSFPLSWCSTICEEARDQISLMFQGKEKISPHNFAVPPFSTYLSGINPWPPRLEEFSLLIFLIFCFLTYLKEIIAEKYETFNKSTHNHGNWTNI